MTKGLFDDQLKTVEVEFSTVINNMIPLISEMDYRSDLLLSSILYFTSSFGKVLPEKQLKEMMTAVSVQTGKFVSDTDTSGYGLGIGFKTTPIGKWWGHSGTTLGYHSTFAWFPKQDITIAIIVNSSSADLENLVVKIVKTIESHKSIPGA